MPHAFASTPPDDATDPVVEAYKRDVDRTILLENLKLSVDERFRRFEKFMEGVDALRAAGKTLRAGAVPETPAPP
jgi:hypothetical protein